MQQNWKRLYKAGLTELHAFEKAAENPRQSQAALLKRLIAENAETEFGRKHGFSNIGSVTDFQASVPIQSYDGYRPWIAKIIAGEKQVLTQQSPICLEQTGGTSKGRKLIPYTADGLESFQRALLAWLADLIRHDPAIMDGRAYFSISPASRTARQFAGDIPIGLPNDAAYFGTELAADISQLLVGALTLSGISDFEDWKIATVACLVSCADLSLISVWSPTFLSLILDTFEAAPDSIFRYLHDNPTLANEQRLSEIKRSIASGRLDTQRLWPNLRLVSAWSDAGSARFATDLAARFPGVKFQPKGLLATEAVFTFPLAQSAFPVPALRSTFLEFEDEQGEIHLIDDVAPGQTYQIIATRPGGLYRYRIGDLVRCEGIFGGAGQSEDMRLPQFSFQGRSTSGSDMVGEKLTEGFVANCLSQCEAGATILVACDQPSPYYALLSDQKAPGDMAQRMDKALMQNPLYADARTIGQLGAVHLIRIENLELEYKTRRLRQGARYGDIKFPVLMPASDAIEKLGLTDTTLRKP